MTNTRESLSVVTRPSASMGRILDWISPDSPLAFVRDGDGIVGIGELLRLEFRGAERFTQAAASWSELSRVAVVHDSVKRAGTGLVALGSFAFADSSAEVSVLIVPRMIIGSRDGIHWVTSISHGEVSGLPETADALAEVPLTPRGAPVHLSFVPGKMSAKGFTTAVNAALREISRSKAAKLVIARDQVATLPAGADLRVPIDALAGRYPDTFTFAVDGLIGSSPETLVRVQNGTVSARVLAGSAARGDNRISDGRAAATLAGSPKDQKEHALALASVMDALLPLSSELVAASTPFALQLPNLWHLATDIEGQLTERSSALDLLTVLHPTAAVAGTPTPDAIRIIDKLEGFDRGRYAGPVGWVDSHGNGEWAVALRCAQVDGTRITAYAGAGIVAGSEAKRELAETELKFRPIVEAFG
ncbi:isochorismate synthase MenF [Salinibacterium sp. M195]|uniref:isochorismate synthase n=1 Tax=Salinibacterium sp. M195 TaxID=2583374 RepID=UPI001C634D34|nr:isochorismate synthase [Salinibacterium sp. M195]QYH34600.1 isochorismate synthase [Salinibacterium sp. M195]